MKVIQYMTLGVDVSRLFSEMIMASASNDLVQKKLVCVLRPCTGTRGRHGADSPVHPPSFVTRGGPATCTCATTPSRTRN